MSWQCLTHVQKSWQTAVAAGEIADVVTEAVAEDPGDRAERRTMRRSGCPAQSLGDLVQQVGHLQDGIPCCDA